MHKCDGSVQHRWRALGPDCARKHTWQKRPFLSVQPADTRRKLTCRLGLQHREMLLQRPQPLQLGRVQHSCRRYNRHQHLTSPYKGRYTHRFHCAAKGTDGGNEDSNSSASGEKGSSDFAAGDSVPTEKPQQADQVDKVSIAKQGSADQAENVTTAKQGSGSDAEDDWGKPAEKSRFLSALRKGAADLRNAHTLAASCRYSSQRGTRCERELNRSQDEVAQKSCQGCAS